MPFELSEEQLVKTEEKLEAKLPQAYRESMLLENGGEATTEGDDWELYPLQDTSDRKRISRTCNHIISETESCGGYRYFPENAISIASNGLGDQMIFLKKDGVFQDTVYLWLHETGETKELAKSFSEIQKL